MSSPGTLKISCKERILPNPRREDPVSAELFGIGRLKAKKQKGKVLSKGVGWRALGPRPEKTHAKTGAKTRKRAGHKERAIRGRSFRGKMQGRKKKLGSDYLTQAHMTVGPLRRFTFEVRVKKVTKESRTAQ